MSLDFTNFTDINSLSAKPKQFPFLNKLNLDKTVINKLSLNLNRVVTGSSEIYLTPIAKENDPDSLLKELDDLISKGNSNLSTNLLDLEQSNRSKFGPRSIAKSWVDRKDSLYDYFKHREDTSNINLRAPNSRPKLRPLSVNNASKYLKKSTNSGLPYYTKKGLVIDDVVNKFNVLLDRQDPCVLFTRTQEGGKTRNIWGYPIVDTLNEMRFYQPLLDHQKKLNWRKALLGPAHVDIAISDMINRSNRHTDSLISIDFSSFDATVGDNLQRASFDYIKSLYQPSTYEEIDYIHYRFNNIGIISPDGVISGSHGVPSGATFTNEVDSLAQHLIVNNSSINCEYQIQGDDGAYLLKDNDVEKLFNSFESSGLIVNKNKSHNSKDFIVYLQRLYDIKYLKNGFIGGIYSLYRALDRLLYQERYSDFMDYSLKGRDYYSLRAITILENCKYHPLFKEFVRFILSKDKYKLSFTTEGLTNYNSMISKGPGTVGFLNNQYGDNVKGIYSFDTIKVIKEIG